MAVEITYYFWEDGKTSEEIVNVFNASQNEVKVIPVSFGISRLSCQNNYLADSKRRY